MPVCDWCHTPLRGLSNTGRPRRYCDTWAAPRIPDNAVCVKVTRIARSLSDQ
jgi:hypothetical protein